VIRRVVVLMAFVLLAAACTRPAPLEIPEPEVVEEVATCDEVADAAEDYVRLMFAELPTVSRSVATGDAPATPRLGALEQIGEIIDERAQRLACDPVDLRAEVNSRITDLESDHPVVAIFLDIVREEGVAQTPDS